MGINFVVIVENSKHVSMQNFKKGLMKDTVIGPYAWNEFSDDSPSKWPPWGEFEWENRKYFTWYFPPRLSNFNLYEFDPKRDEPNACMITFLKIMLLLEQVAGGPVHISNDVVQLFHPDEANDSRLIFHIPGELDYWLKNWREIARLNAKPSLII